MAARNWKTWSVSQTRDTDELGLRIVGSPKNGIHWTAAHPSEPGACCLTTERTRLG